MGDPLAGGVARGDATHHHRHRPDGHGQPRRRAAASRSAGRPTLRRQRASSASGSSAPRGAWYQRATSSPPTAPAPTRTTSPLDVPADSGYVVYRLLPAHRRQRCLDIYGPRAPGSFAVTRGLDPQRHRPATGTSSHAAGSEPHGQLDAQRARGRAGEFGVWVVSTARRLVRRAGSRADDGTSSYSHDVTLNVPADSGYVVYVGYRPTAGSGAWSLWATSPGQLSRDRGASPSASPPRPPRAATPPAASLTVSWTPSAPVARRRQFSVWVVSTARRLVPGRATWSPPTTAPAPTRTASPSTCRPAAATRSIVCYRPTVGSGAWSLSGHEPRARFAVTAVSWRLSVTAPPPARAATPRAASLTVSWTPSAPVGCAASSASGWSAPRGAWYQAGLLRAANGASSYSHSVTLNVPADSGYAVYRRLPAHRRRRRLDLYGPRAPGTLRVTACAAAQPALEPRHADLKLRHGRRELGGDHRRHRDGRRGPLP